MTSSAAIDALDALVSATTVQEVLRKYERLQEGLSLRPFVGQLEFFWKLKQKLVSKQLQKFSKISAILQKLEKRAQNRQYLGNRALVGQRVLVIGGGISGLRVATELLLLGASVLCVEKRNQFTRNNVIHLWPNVISDMKSLGAKRFYGQFCVGAIDHIAIRALQLILLKIALLLGLRFRPNITFQELCPRLLAQKDGVCADAQHCDCCCHSHGFGDGAKAHFVGSESGAEDRELSAEAFDIVIGSDGRRNTLFQDFPRKEFRGKLAIAITANFVNRRGESDVRAVEISGVSYIYNQKWFRALFDDTRIALENICYYSDETHYFVMTATKASLLARGVLRTDLAETHLLLDDANINREELLRYARDAAEWTSGLRDLEFALNGSQSPDVALFDFTSVYAARNASRAKQIRTTCCAAKGEEASTHVLMLLTGDSLLEPFWPTGSGAGRGFLSALDAAYTALQWSLRVLPARRLEDPRAEMDAMVEVLAERESVYRLLAQTTPENISSKDFSSLLPQNRYKKWTKSAVNEVRPQVRHLIGFRLAAPPPPLPHRQSLAAKRARRATVAVTSRDLKDDKDLEFEVIRKELEIERQREETTEEATEGTTDTTTTTVVSASIARKADWLLGSRGVASAVPNGRPLPKVEIVERALELESKINAEKKPFCGQLSRVGRIAENDWNFKPWNENSLFEPKVTPKSPKAVSRAILESRKTQIESKLKDDSKATTTTTTTDKRSNEWIAKMREELSQRLAPELHAHKRETRAPSPPPPAVPTMTVSRECVRCGLEVTGVERISVSGHVLHRSCLRCTKCGISLRLNEFREQIQNEFRNELKFLCIFCLKNNSRIDSQMKAKEMFLKTNERVDFRERIEFQNASAQEIQVVNKIALNADDEKRDTEDDDSATDELAFGLSQSDDNSSECDIDSTTTEDSDDWETQTDDESDDAVDANVDVKRTTSGDTTTMKTTTTAKTTAIPSICVTRETDNKPALNNNNDDKRDDKSDDENDNRRERAVEVRYLGSFTEKLFRSRSQPMIAFKNKLRFRSDAKATDDDTEDDDSTLPFADFGLNDDAFGQHFSPVRALKAPIIDFNDI